MTDTNTRHLVLIDGSGYIFRAYHALPPLTRKSDGAPTGAVSGFCNMLNKLVEEAIEDDDVDLFCVVFDAARATFRNEIYPDYKANRPPPPEDLVPQFAMIKDASRAFNLATVEMPGFEADDVIATYARLADEAGIKVTIVSSDKDLMQLVRNQIGMLDPMKNRRIGHDEVIERFGVGPDKVVEVQALAGDSTDNVPGVPGIGVKTAAQLIHEYGDLDTLLARAEEIKQPKRRQNLLEHADLARVSRNLVRLKDDVEVPYALDELRLAPPQPDVLLPFLEEMEFTRLLARARGQWGGDGTDGSETDPVGFDEAAPDEVDYVLVREEDELRVWIEEAQRAGQVAFDTETTSLDAMAAELVGFSLSIRPGRACYVPVGHVRPKRQGELDLGAEGAPDDDGPPEQMDKARALALMKPLLESPAVLKIGQNIKYDAMVMVRHGVRITPIDDTMLLSYVVEGGLHGHGMDELSQMHLSIKPIPFKEVAGSGKNAITFAEVPLDKARDYAAEDADITLRLHHTLKPRMLEARKVAVYERLERPLVSILVDMERAGIKVDVEELRRLSGDFAQRMGGLEAEIHELAGEDFNIGSPKQLGEVLFDKMSLPGGRKTKTGAYGTSHDVLEGLAAQGHDLPARVLDWRQLAKLKSTYTDSLQGQINAETGRVHTSYAMAATSTGRLASTDPNLQNIPVRTEEGRKIRRAFIAAPGHKLMSADYSQIELRVLAHIADIDGLKQAFHDGLDIHAMTASQVFDVPLDEMNAATRRNAKAINFGIIYGISAFGLARNLAIPQGDAQRYIEAYFERYPGIRTYMDETKAFARANGYVETLFGRRAHMRGINEKNPAQRNFSERAAINAPIQGTAADIIRRAMIRIPDALADADLAATMLLQVHDELIFEVPDDEIDQTAVVVKATMEGAAHLDVPLVVDTGVGDNWDEAH